MIKRWLISIVFIVACTGVIAQQIVLDKNVDKQYNGTHGPNMRHYSHFYIAGGFVMPFDEKPGAKIGIGRSMDYLFGLRYKLKLLSFYAIGMDASYKYVRYRIANENLPFDQDKPLTQATTADKFSIGISSFGLEAYNRINIGPHGNTLGQYIDIGFKEEWNFGTREIIKNKLESSEMTKKERTVRKGLKYINTISTLATARIGYNKFALFGNYRLSDIFKEKNDLVEIPALTIGLQLKL